MNVVYASNDNYARHLATSMISLFDKNQDMKEITVYVLSVGIEDESCKRLKAIADRYGRTLQMMELNDIESRFAYDIDTRGFDISAMGSQRVGHD